MTSQQAILSTGGAGQLGRELRRLALPDGWEVVALTRDDLDLTNTAAIAECVARGHRGKPWSAVINAGAYTAVDQAETDVLTAWSVNALAPAALAAACVACDVPLVQVSTDYVFSGDQDDAWEPEDPIGPLGVYGASKLGGELAVRTSGARYTIVRTAWVVSAHGSNFITKMLELARTRDAVSVVADQYGCPTAAADLAAALVSIAIRLAQTPDDEGAIVHFCNAGATNWSDFAAEIFRRSAKRGGPSIPVSPVASTAYPTAARRPPNSRLSLTALDKFYGIKPRPWEAAVDDILDELIGPIR